MINNNLRISSTSVYQSSSGSQGPSNSNSSAEPEELVFDLSTGTVAMCEKPYSLAQLKKMDTSYIV